MSVTPTHYSARVWALIPLIALGFLLWAGYRQFKHIDGISDIGRETARLEAASPTGYADGKRWLIMPQHDYRSYQWIAETQQMFAQHEWRVRRIDFENAPAGREVHTPSPYRWWLGLVAWCDHVISKRPLGLSVELAALSADPIFYLLFALVTAFFVRRRFGNIPSGIFLFGLVTLFPLATLFLPGAPDDYGLSLACAIWSVLPLIAAVFTTPPSAMAKEKEAPAQPGAGQAAKLAQRDFLLAGVAGGLGLWINVTNQVPILIGIALSAVAATWIKRHRRESTQSVIAYPWLTWAAGGAATSLFAYLIEYFPAHLDFQLEVNHPLYALAWIGVGFVLSFTETLFERNSPPWNWRKAGLVTAAVLAIASVPVAMTWARSAAFLNPDLLDSRLGKLPDARMARNLATLIMRDGLTANFAVTCIPILLLVPAFSLITNRKLTDTHRAALALTLGPTLAALALAVTRLRAWSLVDGMLLVVVVAVAALLQRHGTSRQKQGWAGIAGIIFLGGLCLAQRGISSEKSTLTRLEAEGLLERGLAHWISDHTGSGGAVVIAPPEQTASLCFYGRLRGLGTPNWENQRGVISAARILGSPNPEVVQALLGAHGITHIVVPSWNNDLDEIVRLTAEDPMQSFLEALHHWSIPPWLKALPYPLPLIAGFEDASVSIFEITNENNRATGLSRLAEYFLETHQADQAGATGQTLQQHFATDLGALVAIAQIENAAGDHAAFAKTFETILPGLAGGFDRTLAWDRRVSLATILAIGQRQDLAREQIRRCLEKIDEAKLRSLTTVSLYRLQVLAKTFDLKINDPHLQQLALSLLPSELRDRL